MAKNDDIQASEPVAVVLPPTGLGVASFVIGLLSLLVMGFSLRFGLLANGSGHPGTYNLAFEVFGEMLFAFVGISTLGIGFGVAALRRRKCRRGLSIAGLAINLTLVVVIVAVLLLGDHSYSNS